MGIGPVGRAIEASLVFGRCNVVSWLRGIRRAHLGIGRTLRRGTETQPTSNRPWPTLLRQIGAPSDFAHWPRCRLESDSPVQLYGIGQDRKNSPELVFRAEN